MQALSIIAIMVSITLFENCVILIKTHHATALILLVFSLVLSVIMSVKWNSEFTKEKLAREKDPTNYVSGKTFFLAFIPSVMALSSMGMLCYYLIH